MFGLCAVKRETSVVLPVPDAAEITNTLPLAVVMVFTFYYKITHNYAIVFRLPTAEINSMVRAFGISNEDDIRSTFMPLRHKKNSRFRLLFEYGADGETRTLTPCGART